MPSLWYQTKTKPFFSCTSHARTRAEWAAFYDEHGYNWRLMKLLQADPTPRFDLCFVDGAHSWADDGFGLAQLHQLRGRVGRGVRPSFCVAVHGRLTEAATKRLEIFRTARDGFEIAEADLELRGPGDLLGRRQAGLPTLRVADLVAHRDWIERARSDAREISSRRDEPAFAPLVAAARRRLPERYRALAGG